jgi:UDP-N-acetylmuramyl pentapeptide synthase
MAKMIKAKKKILVLTEMRPLTFNVEGFYNELGKASTFADHVYFLGPLKYFELLQKNNSKIKYIKIAEYPIVAEEILQNSNSGDVILLKGSFRYRLEDLRKLLI